MAEDTETTFRTAVVFFTVAMLLPVLPAVLAHHELTRLGYHTFLGLVVVGTGLVAVALIELLELDRITFLYVSIVWPWVVFLTALLFVLLLNPGEPIPEGPVADVFQTLRGGYSMWYSGSPSFYFSYGAAFVVAGTGAVAFSTLIHRFPSEPTTSSE